MNNFHTLDCCLISGNDFLVSTVIPAGKPSRFQHMKNTFLVAILSFILLSCGVKLPAYFREKALAEQIYVENRKDDYLLHTGKTSAFSKIRIQGEKEETDLKTQNNVVSVADRKDRPYFYFIQNQDTLIVANRQIYFKDVINFRDIGGLKTKAGRTIKWGKIFRSDNLSEMKTREFDKLNNLHIGTIFDLRTAGEIKGKEDHLPGNIAYVHAPTIQDNAELLTQLRHKVLNGTLSEAQSMDLTLQLYRDNVSKNLPQLRQLVNQILDSEEPVLYHCSAGKDRTGILTALILSILNVDREIILNEYMLSNHYRSAKIEKMLGQAKLLKVVKPHLNLAVIQNFMQVDKQYLNASFDLIDQQYGNIDGFIHDALGINEQKRSMIIQKLTY